MINKIGIPGDFFKPERSDFNDKEKQIAKKAPVAPLRGESSASIISPSITEALIKAAVYSTSAVISHSPVIASDRTSESKLVFSGADPLGSLEKGEVVYQTVAQVMPNPPVRKG